MMRTQLACQQNSPASRTNDFHHKLIASCMPLCDVEDAREMTPLQSPILATKVPLRNLAAHELTRRRQISQNVGWACVLVIGASLSGCASTMHSNEPKDLASDHTVTAQCTVTNTSDGTPCIQEARQACQSENVRLQQIMSRNVIPATQGVDQTPMPIAQYVVAYVCHS